MEIVNKTLVTILFCLAQFTIFGQKIDSLIFGTWKWQQKNDSIVVLKQTDQFKRKPESFLIDKDDTSFFRSMYYPVCGMSRGKFKFQIKKGSWQINSNELLVLKYELHYAFIEEYFNLIEHRKRKLILKRVNYIEIPLPKDQ